MDNLTDMDFSFPGEPYGVQKELMCAIYSAIENRQIGLFESPTGTGKTLSIICASLTWLAENRHATFADAASAENDEPDWVVEQTRSRDDRLARDELMRRKEAYRRRVNQATDRPRGTNMRKRGKGSCAHNPVSTVGDLLSSDEEDDGVNVPREKRKVKSARIIFATRTHSQLTQFLEELRKTRFNPPAVMDNKGSVKPAFPTHGKESGLHHFELPLSVMPFGSRKQFCVNQEVRALESSAAISERCRELTEAPAETSAAKRKRNRNRCEYKNPDTEAILRDRALVQMQSIEELGESGKKLGACPYFATRAALETGDVDVIGVPYSALLHAPTRQSLGLEIDDNTVVIFDEAHNIVNTVCDLHSSVLTRAALVQTIAALKAYISRYENRFSGGNLFNLRQLVALSQGLLSLLPGRNDEKNRRKLPKPKVVRPSAMLFDAGVDNINLFSLVSFMEESRLSKKLRGFVDSGSEFASDSQHPPTTPQTQKESQRDNDVNEQRRAKQSLASFENFVRNIAECPSYGRVGLYPFRRDAGQSVNKRGSETDAARLGLDAVARLKYFVTEPGQLFSSNVGNARSILMLGGTLSPRTAIKDGLLGPLSRGSVAELECEHVVPADHVLTRVCSSGPSGAALEFTYQRRQSPGAFDELGLAVEQVARRVPGGVVVFFSSYELLRQTRQRWESSGALRRVGSVKPFFAEERGDNEAFEAYREAVEQDPKRGATLAAVMGGKLSEGINFSDALGRAVVMVGMPFANAAQVETGEMLKRFGSASERSAFLENQCMTVVNQCIGRAVRHKRDYATILLMDRRYSRRRVIEKLPRFVRRDLECPNVFGQVQEDVSAFFGKREAS